MYWLHICLFIAVFFFFFFQPLLWLNSFLFLSGFYLFLSFWFFFILNVILYFFAICFFYMFSFFSLVLIFRQRTDWTSQFTKFFVSDLYLWYSNLNWLSVSIFLFKFQFNYRDDPVSNHCWLSLSHFYYIVWVLI